MMTLRVQMEIANMKPCAFCVWHTHKFPDDAEHNRMHEEGWHTCGLDGKFRQYGGDCGMFMLDSGVQSSF